MHAEVITAAPAAPQADLSTPSSKDLSMRHAPAIHRIADTCPSRLRRLAGTGPSRLRRLAGTLASLTIAGLGLTATPALAEECPNAALRVENNSTRLPECRAYEMVSPLYKEGFAVEPKTYSDDGAVAYVSTGNFAGDPAAKALLNYLATRSATGWTTTALDPSEATYFDNGRVALSADLRSSLWEMGRRDDPASRGDYYLRSPDGVFTRVGNGMLGENPPGTLGVSEDLSHVIIDHGEAGNAAVRALYELTPGPQRPVSVDNTGTPTPGETCFNNISNDGRVIVFTTGCPTGSGVQQTVLARVGESATVAVSRSECTRTSGDPGGLCNAPANAAFAGAATDGSRVYFTTTQQLVNGDTDQSNDLYECEIPPGTPAPVGTANPCASLSEVSGAASGANVESVVDVSEDGSRVYFVAQGVLAANLGSNDATAVAGDHNLYVWEKDAAHSAGQTTFVAKLDSNDIFRPQSTTDGRYLVFNTANRLLASDTDEAADVYRYDADTGALLRLSTDTDGSGGNEPGAEAVAGLGFGSQHPHYTMTDDASTVIFETSEALSPTDTDGVTDAYAWHDGQVSLISNGGGVPLGISSSGQDIFFLTGQPLTPGDSGVEGDIYDARVGGGFPVTTPAPCSGEACQGSVTLQPQPPGASASAAFNGPGNPRTAESPPANPKPKPATAAQKLAKALKACRSKHNKKKRTACEKKARNTYRRGK